MNEVNRTLFIPLYGKAKVSRQNKILHDPRAEEIWEAEGFRVHGKSKSKWLAYNMAMRARVFDDWTERMLGLNKDALVLHIGCGLDSRCERVKASCGKWVDCDLPEVIEVRRKYFSETETYQMRALDASDPEQIQALPDSPVAVVVLEGLCMYLTKEQLHAFLEALILKYPSLHILMDVYTEFGARASRYKNPVNEVGVTTLYGIDDLWALTRDLKVRIVGEHTFTPDALVEELNPGERLFFQCLFTDRIYRKIYRLYELTGGGTE